MNYIIILLYIYSLKYLTGRSFRLPTAFATTCQAFAFTHRFFFKSFKVLSYMTPYFWTAIIKCHPRPANPNRYPLSFNFNIIKYTVYPYRVYQTWPRTVAMIGPVITQLWLVTCCSTRRKNQTRLYLRHVAERRNGACVALRYRLFYARIFGNGKMLVLHCVALPIDGKRPLCPCYTNSRCRGRCGACDGCKRPK